MQKPLIICAALFLLTTFTEIPLSMAEEIQDAQEHKTVSSEITPDSLTNEVLVCLPEEEYGLGSALEEAGWTCFNIVPGIVSLANVLIGSDARMASAEEHWEAYKNGTLLQNIKEQNGWVNGASLLENLGNVVSMNIRGFLNSGKCIGENNYNRIKHPDKTLINFFTTVNTACYQFAEDLFVTPTRGALVALGTNVKPPTAEEWGRAYVALPMVLYPVARSEATAAVLTKIEGRASIMMSQAQEAAQAVANTVKRVSSDFIEGNMGNPQLCFAGAEGSGFNSPACVFTNPKLEQAMLMRKGRNPFWGQWGGAAKLERYKGQESTVSHLRHSKADFYPSLIEQLKQLKTMAKKGTFGEAEVEEFIKISQKLRKDFLLTEKEFQPTVRKILATLEEQGLSPKEIYYLKIKTLSPNNMVLELDNLIESGKRLILSPDEEYFFKYGLQSVQKQGGELGWKLDPPKKAIFEKLMGLRKKVTVGNPLKLPSSVHEYD